MKDEEILYKVLKKARKNRPDLISEGTLDCPIEYREYYKVIFDLDFAKAYWGEGQVCFECGHTLKECRIDQTVNYCGVEGNGNTAISCQYHLQQMVLAEDKLKYLEKFL